jgi:hypothetical protein
MHHDKTVWAFIALLVVFFLSFVYALFSLRQGRVILGLLAPAMEAWLIMFLSIAAMGKVVYEIILVERS